MKLRTTLSAVILVCCTPMASAAPPVAPAMEEGAGILGRALRKVEQTPSEKIIRSGAGVGRAYSKRPEEERNSGVGILLILAMLGACGLLGLKALLWLIKLGKRPVQPAPVFKPLPASSHIGVNLSQRPVSGPPPLPPSRPTGPPPLSPHSLR